MERNGSCTRNTRLAKKMTANMKKPKALTRKKRKVLRRIYIFTQHKRLEKHSRTCIDMESSLLTRPPEKGPRARTKSHQQDRAHAFLRPEGHSGATARTARRKNVHNRHAVAQRNRLLGPVFSGRRSQNQKPAAQRTVHAHFLKSSFRTLRSRYQMHEVSPPKKTINI
jgi:hypothetical protein